REEAKNGGNTGFGNEPTDSVSASGSESSDKPSNSSNNSLISTPTPMAGPPLFVSLRCPSSVVLNFRSPHKLK
ncbi:unnamed protein product, partial [Allacma fusca]